MTVVEGEPRSGVPEHGTAWEITAVAALAALALGATQLVVAHRGLGLGRSPLLLTLSVILPPAVAVTAIVLSVRERRRPAAVIRSLSDAWRAPSGAWVACALGVVVAIPLWVLYAPIVFGDADSARIVAATRYLLDGHDPLDYFRRTQEPTLPPIVLGPVVALWGLAGVKAFAIVSLQVVAGVTAFITYRVTRSLWGAAVAAASLLCLAAVTERAVKLPFYGVMLALGYLGAWLSYAAMTEPDRRFRYALAAGPVLALAAEAHGVGLLFLAVPVLVSVFARDLRDAVDALVRIYGAALVILVPRLAINLSDGGLTAVTSPRADYWITEGHLTEIQTSYFGYAGVGEGRREFLSRLPERFIDLLGPHGWLIVVLATVAAVLACRGRARIFVLAAIGFFVVAVTQKRIPPFARYYAPVWPGLAVLVGVGCAALLRRGVAGRIAAGLVSVVVAVTAVVTLGDASAAYEARRETITSSAMATVAGAVDDGKGVIGARATQVFFSVGADVATWGDQFLTEDEYVTYLTWPSDREVLAMLDEHDIGWVYVISDPTLEIDYNDTWLKPAHGVEARHVSAVDQSPNFCRWLTTLAGNRLYRVGACDEVGPSSYDRASSSPPSPPSPPS